MDLTSCDREPIHVPGSIQPHGLLLVLDSQTEVVKQFAGDPAGFLGVVDPLGLTAHQLFGTSVRSLAPGDIRPDEQPVFIGGLSANASASGLRAAVQWRGNVLILEVEAAPEIPLAAATFLSNVSREGIAIQRATSLEQTCDEAAAAIARLTDFDRVMVYQFLPDHSGKVIAECLSGDLGSLLNQHFPASDIPRQARALYLRNLIRVIPDVSYVPLPLTPGVPEDGDLDMTDCTLRSVSPIHLQYLKNMGVGASLSVSIMEGDSLWGLFACHHTTSKAVSFEAREACKQVGALLGLQLQHLGARRDAEKLARLAECSEGLIVTLSKEGVHDDIQNRLSEILAFMGGDGLIYAAGNRLETVGSIPSEERCRELLQWLRSEQPTPVFTTSRLSEHFQIAGDYPHEASGILSIAIEDDEPIHLIWLRREYAEEVLWAGNPHKDGGPGGDLTPRHSFEVWREEVRGQSLPWDDVDRAAAATFRDRLEAICARQRLIDLQAELIFVSRVSAMGAMAATLAHELNQPLTAISNYSAGLRRIVADDADQPQMLKDGVEAIEENALRAGQVIRSLREMVKRGDASRSAQVLEDIIQQAVALVQAGETRCAAANITCDFQHQRKVLADPIQIQQVIVNLVRNACEASTSCNSPQIKLSTKDCDGHILVEVKDQGDGIPDHVLGKIFEAFSSTKAEGMGVGLSICRTIIEANGGKIEAANHPDGGAVFSFTLPAG